MDRILYFSTFSIYNVQMRESFFNVWIRVHSFSYFCHNSGVYFLVLLVKAIFLEKGLFVLSTSLVLDVILSLFISTKFWNSIRGFHALLELITT